MRVSSCFLIAFLLTGVAVAQNAVLDRAIGRHWYGLYMNGQKAGYSYSEIAVDDAGIVTVTDDASFKLNMVGMKQDMRIFSSRTYSESGDLIRIVSQVDDISGRNSFEAVIRGETIELTSKVAGRDKTVVYPRPNESLSDVLMRFELISEQAEVGDSARFYMFEPMYEVEIEGRSEIIGIETRLLDGVETEVFVVRTILDVMQIESVSYITRDGTILEDRIAGGIITMRLEPEAMAKDVDYMNDVIVSNAARVDEKIENPRKREEVRLQLTGPLKAVHLINDERQSMIRTDEYIEFTGRLLSLDEFESATLPIHDEKVEKWLEPSMFVQSDAPELIAKAREIVGDETDALAVSTLLSDWVSDNMLSTFSARLTNSLEVLEHLEGDCTEHSMLFVGLARAAGLPAREVAGLIYVDAPHAGFYFHQWASVWVGMWIDVDPTFDQPIADATHIKLAEGDLFEQAKLLPIIGRIEIEIAD